MRSESTRRGYLSDYWDRYWTRRRATRRGFLGGGMALSAGAASLALVGCGDDDDDDEGTGGGGQQGGGQATATSTAGGGDQEARYGGTIRFPMTGLNSGDPPTLFPYENITYRAQMPASFHYSRLLSEYGAPDVAIDDFTVLEGDLAESLPEQPDEVTYIFKLRENIHWHDKPPMNGRKATAEDFVQTYQAFVSVAQNAALYENIVDRVEAVDEYRVKFTLKEPYAPFLVIQASTYEGLWFIPVETINNGQVQTDPVGTGPWVFENYNSGVSITWSRNKNYYRTEGWPYYDRVEASLVGDPQRIIAGLKSGDLDFSGLSAAVYNDATSQLDPAGQSYFSGAGSPLHFWFNFDIEGGRWRDKRLRQALSMSINRDGILNALDPTGKGNWMSPFVTPGLPPWYLSPRDNDYGENAKYLKYDPAEARKLFEAATGESNPRVVINSTEGYGVVFTQQWELLAASLQEAGWQVERRNQEYGRYITSVYLGDIQEGVAWGFPMGATREPSDMLERTHYTASARRNWKGTPIDEQDRIDQLIEQQKRILDFDERLQFIHDMQKELAEYLLFVPTVGEAGFSYVNPWVQGYHPKAGYATHFAAMTRSWFTPERIAKG